MFVDGSGQNEQFVERTFHRGFLPSFTSFGWAVSEEKIKMWKVNRRRMPSDGKSSHCFWQGELKITVLYINLSIQRLNQLHVSTITRVFWLKWFHKQVFNLKNNFEVNRIKEFCHFYFLYNNNNKFFIYRGLHS